MANGSEMEDNPAVTRILEISRDDPGRLRELERFRRPITVLFADVAGSTSYFERFGDIPGLAMVHNFNRMVRKAVEEFAGRVIKNIGDGVMATFEAAEQSVQASIEIQLRLRQMNVTTDDGHRLAVRIGIHHGMGIVRSDNDVFGDVVNVASRIQSLAQPEQILISDAVEDKIRDCSFRLQSLGLFQLKGKTEELDLFEVRWVPEVPPCIPSNDSGQLRVFRLCHLGADRVVDADSVPIGDGLTIGRDCADLTFPESLMDSPHVRLLIANGFPVIEDLTSHAGVFVQMMGAHILKPDDTLMMGGLFFRFIRVSESAALERLDGAGMQTGERYPLGEKEVRFGRNQGDYTFPDEGFMSRTHARLFKHGPDDLIEDLGSRNGTFLKVRGSATVPLRARIWIAGEYFSVLEIE